MAIFPNRFISLAFFSPLCGRAIAIRSSFRLHIGSGIIAWVISLNGGIKDAGIWAWIPMAAYLALLTLGTIATTFFTPEPRARDLVDLRDAVDVK